MRDAEILDVVLRDLRAEFADELLGVIATGSRIRGEGDPASDIDVPVLIAQPRRQRRNVVVAGVEVEMFINPPWRFLKYLEGDRADGTGAAQHMLVTGHIIHDPTGAAAELCDEARRQWEAGPPALTATDQWSFRYFAADSLRDIDDVMTADPARAALLGGPFLLWLLERHYRIQRRWRPKPKRLLLDLATWDAHAASLARSAVGRDGGAGCLRGLADHVMAPLGGLMPLAWNTEWEELLEPPPNGPLSGLPEPG